MAQNQYVTLLRGINVGGNNGINMADLKACFEKMGFTNVSTYIQSGNVIFNSDSTDKLQLTDKIEKGLSERFNYLSRIVVLSHKELRTAVEGAPEGYGRDPGNYRYDVLFLKEPLVPDDLMKKLKLRDGVDNTYKGDFVIYFTRLISKAGQSYLGKVILPSDYQFITVRNWNTTTKLLVIMNN